MQISDKLKTLATLHQIERQCWQELERKTKDEAPPPELALDWIASDRALTEHLRSMVPDLIKLSS